MRLLYRTRSCGSSNCPSIYRADDGQLVVQGWTVPDNGGITIPDGEGVVAIPPDVQQAIAEDWNARNGAEQA